MLIQQSTHLPNCWNLVFGQGASETASAGARVHTWEGAGAGRRIRIGLIAHLGQTGAGARGARDVGPRGKCCDDWCARFAGTLRGYSLSRSLPRPPFLFSGKVTLVGVIGRIPVIVAPQPSASSPPQQRRRRRQPSSSYPVCLFLRAATHPATSPYTAVNRVYPLAVAQPFNQTD